MIIEKKIMGKNIDNKTSAAAVLSAMAARPRARRPQARPRALRTAAQAGRERRPLSRCG